MKPETDMPGNSSPTHWIGQRVTVTMDRPMGTRHPSHGFVYPVNYGFIAGTISGDGEPVDAYVLGLDHPVDIFTGTCIAVIHRLNDDDDKLIVVPAGFGLSDDEIREQTHFQEQWFQSRIIRSGEI